ncbi:hypothetical protein CLOACE_07820 [Clostridium acetireducens DSM 10703]|uniref:Uncharacterized protein n=1 Tax=Clostridium acetireducens DSM 10703 TaxID=1121290 RepID=A0A1E8F071_9CLOT|nr:hypothetical protein CLOACE_07820 [Clostridium acetireducens DSM 10703]
MSVIPLFMFSKLLLGYFQKKAYIKNKIYNSHESSGINNLNEF